MINNITGRQKINNGAAGRMKKEHTTRRTTLFIACSPHLASFTMAHWVRGRSGRAAHKTCTQAWHIPLIAFGIDSLCVLREVSQRQKSNIIRRLWSTPLYSGRVSARRVFIFFFFCSPRRCRMRVDYYFMQGVAYFIKNSLFARALAQSLIRAD
jgi:hypothetical protein